jgi:AraC family transcriptional regulator, transcriptional activator FtrA
MTTTPTEAPAKTSGPLVAVLVYDGLCTFEFGVAYEVFGLARPEMGEGWYRYRLAAAESGLLRAASGLTIEADTAGGALEDAGTIIIPGWRGMDVPVPESLCEALRSAHARGARLASLCSGVFVLAAAGLLDGKRATTHWRYTEALAARYPAIRIEPDVLYVDNGDILTAAGSAAGIDLCLHIVRQDFGAEAASSVARRMVVPPHRDGGQAQYIERPVPAAYEGQRLGALIDWMRRNLGTDMPLQALALRAGMSLRTFQRRFEVLTGLPPGQWITRERIDAARRILEEVPEVLLEDVAAQCGFATQAALRHHFRNVAGTTPAAYRQRFGHRS